MDNTDQENPVKTDPHFFDVPCKTSLSEPGPGARCDDCSLRNPPGNCEYNGGKPLLWASVSPFSLPDDVGGKDS